MNMKTIRKTNYLALAAIVMTTSCSMIKPKCQRFKLSEILNREDKNPTLVEYDQDSICRPTVAGFQELYDLKYENPNEKYYWNHKQCKWITESEQDSIIEAVFNQIAEDMIEEEGYLDGEKD